jgi:hypothetical protein
MEPRAPVLATGGGAVLSADLSTEDRSTIQTRLAQAGAHAPLLTSEVAKLTAAADAAAYDFFGYSVAVSGDTVVVGADWAGNTGAAYIFARNYDPIHPGTPLADNWGQVQKLTAGDASAGHRFGKSVALNEDTVVVGSHAGLGAAYVFERNQGGVENWGEEQKLTASDAGAWDRFGTSVAISGDTVVVGAWGDEDHVVSAYIFARNYDPGDPGTPSADKWGEVQKLTASDAVAGDYFGYSVSISGDTVVVGAYGDDDGGNTSGSAYVFERNQGGADNWGQVDKLTAGDAAADDRFGYSVAISDNTVVAGAYGDDDGGSASGSAYVFARRGATWPQQAKPTAGDAAAGDNFGTSVAISGDAFIAGAPGNDDSGSTYLFYRNQDGADQWGQARKRHNSLLPAHAEFGTSVAIDVDAAVVGTYYADKAYVFERNSSGADQWGHMKTLSGGSDSEFGKSVSISGDTIIVGAPKDNVACDNCGAAYVFERNYDPSNPGTPLVDNWGLRAVLTATYGAAEWDWFGHAVTISGDTVVVGAPNYDHVCPPEIPDCNSGSVCVFKRNYDWDHPTVPKADNWGLVRKLMADDSAAFDMFGYAVAISGDTFVVGAPKDDSSAGSVYVFERNHDWHDGWGQVRKVVADDPASGDQFGYSLAIGGDTMADGAPFDDDGGSASGSAYLFRRNEGGADQWGQVEKLTADDAARDDAFGWSVSVSGNTVVVGARTADDAGDASGSTYVFRWTAAGVYLPLVLKD